MLFDAHLDNACAVILSSLKKRDIAFFKCLAYLACDARHGHCYASIPHIGLLMGQGNYGYKAIKRTASKAAFRALDSLSLFNKFRPSRRSSYRIKLTNLGQYLYNRLLNRIVITDSPRVSFEKATFEGRDSYPQMRVAFGQKLNNPKEKATLEIEKSDPREVQNPTHQDQERSKKNHPIEILPSTTTERCNYTNIGGDNSIKMESVLNSVPHKLREKVIHEYNTYCEKNSVTDRRRVMEVIAHRIVREQSEIDRIAREDRERSLRMQALTIQRRLQEDSLPQYSYEERRAILERVREARRGILHGQ